LTEIAISEAEQAARDRAVVRARRDDSAQAMLLRTRARDTKNDKPPPMPDLGARRARAVRWEWIRWHKRQAAALAERLRHHEAEAARLEGAMSRGAVTRDSRREKLVRSRAWR